MKIAIVGSKPDTWTKVPELGPDWEIWRFSRANFNKPPTNYTRWFELHDPKHYPRYEVVVPGYVEFLRTDPRVVLPDQFPFDDLLRQFGPYFFTGGQAPWIMAYAITCNPETIGLWGIDPVGDYKPQRSEVQHFVQMARDRLIEVIAPEETILEPRELYALQTDTLTQTLDRLGISKERQSALFKDPPKDFDAGSMLSFVRSAR